MPLIPLQDTLKALYEQDFLLWVDRIVELLKARDFDNIDLENLIDEVEDLGSEKKHAVDSYTIRLLIHLLLYQYWPTNRDYYLNGWAKEIGIFRAELNRRFEKSKSLYNYFLTEIDRNYNSSRRAAANKSTLPLSLLPEKCPYTVEQMLDFEFLPS